MECAARFRSDDQDYTADLWKWNLNVSGWGWKLCCTGRVYIFGVSRYTHNKISPAVEIYDIKYVCTSHNLRTKNNNFSFNVMFFLACLLLFFWKVVLMFTCPVCWNTYSWHTHTHTVGLCAEPVHKGYHNSGFEVGAEVCSVLSQARQGERSYVRNAQNQIVQGGKKKKGSDFGRTTVDCVFFPGVVIFHWKLFTLPLNLKLQFWTTGTLFCQYNDT